MVIRRNRFLQHIDAITRRKVAVIGPAVAEIDELCAATRLAPDRCMPVYRVDESSIHPGGAALTAATISGLGGRATLVAPVGRGRPGMALRRVLDEHRVHLVECGEEGVRTPELIRYVTPGAARHLLQMRRGWQEARFVDLSRALDRAAQPTDPGDATEPNDAIDALCLVDGLPAALTERDVADALDWADARAIPIVFDAAGANLVPLRAFPTTAAAGSAGAPGDRHARSTGRTMKKKGVRHFVLNAAESVLFARRLGLEAPALRRRSATTSPNATTNATATAAPSPATASFAEAELRAGRLASRLDAVIVLTLGPEGAIVALPEAIALLFGDDDDATDFARPAARPTASTAAGFAPASAAHDIAASAAGSALEGVRLARVPTNPLPMSDRRGVGFVFSGVYALMVAAGATPVEAAFLASGSATAAAAQPGPKRVTMDGLVKIAYREIEAHVADGIEVFDRMARDHLPVIDRAARLLLDAYNEGRQVLVFGNGGSAAEANHLAGELTGRFRQSRPGLPAISLSANDSIATCIANDYGYDEVFSRQIDTFCRPGDVVIGLTTSGRSGNVVRAMERARAIGARTIALVGADPGPLAEFADVAVTVPSRSTGRIQEAHLFVIHVMCDMLDRRLDALGRLQPAASEI